MQATWSALLQRAVNDPGTISAAYSAFHNYSFGNQMLAAFQCDARGLPYGPISTFHGWVLQRRVVKRHEKALTLCMPIITKTLDSNKQELIHTIFVFKNNWFVYAQTDGDEIQVKPIPGWDKELAMKKFNVTEIPYDLMDGNCQGFARRRQIAISPIAAHPWSTWLHELAHVILHQTDEPLDTTKITHGIKEVEAEAVALLVSESLGSSEPTAESRGYIQHWLKEEGNDAIPDHVAARIFGATDKILRAGYPEIKKGE